MKKILFVIFILISLFIISCNNQEDPISEPEKTYLYLYREDTFIEEKEVLVGSKIDFKLEDPDYYFIGWYDESGKECLDGKVVTSDEMWLYAKVIKYGTKYMITYHLDEEAELNPGYPSKHVFGTKTELNEPVRPLNYKFTGWYDNEERSGEPITEIPADYYGTINLWDSWADENTYYNINYNADGVTTYSEEIKTKVMEGVEYVLPYPIKDGYYFRGWYLEPTFKTRVYKVTTDNKEDLTIYAKFAKKTASDTYLSICGDSISTHRDIIPTDALDYYPSQMSIALNNTYFMQVVNKLGVNLLKNNSYSGSRLTSDLTSNGVKIPAATSDSRINNLGDEEHDPDILIVHMGTNDYSQGVAIYNFKAAIIKFMKKVRALYDDVDVYFCLHPYNGYPQSYATIREQFNDVILEFSTKYNYKIIDLTKAWGKSDYSTYIFSNAHPNQLGFNKMAEVIIEELKKEYNFTK